MPTITPPKREREDTLSSSLEGLETTEQPLHGETDSQNRIHARHRSTRRRILQVLSHSGIEELEKRARRISACCCVPFLCVTDDGKPRLQLGLCRDRLCPTCQQDRARRAAEKTLALIQDFNAPRFFTLTLSHAGESLESMVRFLMESFRRLKRSETWKARVTSGVYSIEVTFNTEAKEWHAHLHVIADGEYFPHSELKEAWKIASGGSEIVWIRSVPDRERVAKYISNYVAKSPGMNTWPDFRIWEFALALAGKRLLHTFGRAHGTTIDAEKESETGTACPRLVCLPALTRAAENGCPYGRTAVELLRRLGRRWCDALGVDDCGESRGLPPVEDWELIRLITAARRVAGDLAAKLPDLEPDDGQDAATHAREAASLYSNSG